MNTQSELPFSRITERLATPYDDVWRIHYEALKRIELGEEITLLSVGDPDFNTPEEITRHLIERINAGRTHYSPAAGERVLREALAELERETARLVMLAESAVEFCATLPWLIVPESNGTP